MATMKLTAIGLERELSYSNKSLFDLFDWFTDTQNKVDKTALKNRILMRCGEFEVLYSDPDFFRECIGVWSTAYKRTFEKWLNVIYTDYNPLENYDMEERFQDDGHNTREASGNTSKNTSLNTSRNTSESTSLVIDADDTKNMSNSASGSNHSQTVVDNDQTSSASSTGAHNVSAFDSSTYSPESQDTKTDSATASADETSTTDGTTSTTGSAQETDAHDETQTGLNTGSETGSNTGTETGTHSDDEETKTHSIHTGVRHGNIGVTSSQQLMESEMRVALFSFYDKVAELFVNEFCVMVY